MEPLNFSPYLRLIQKTGATKHPYGFSATDLLLKRIDVTNTTEVLDLGCGAGHTTAYVAKNYDCTITGADISADAIERANALHKNEPFFERMSFVQADALHLPFDDGKFDVVLCESVLFFVHDKAAALKEMARVLKPGGHLALNEVIVSTGPEQRKIQDYFLRPEFGGFLVNADGMREGFDMATWLIVMEDEKPFDVKQQLIAEFKNLISFKTLLPLFELAHQAVVSKEMRDDLVRVAKFVADLPKGTIEKLNSYLLLAQKKPLG